MLKKAVSVGLGSRLLRIGDTSPDGKNIWNGTEWVTLHATFSGEPLCDCGVWDCLYPWERKRDANKANLYGENIRLFPRPASHVQYKKDLQKRKDAEMSRVELVYKTKQEANDMWYNERYEQIRAME